MRITIVCVGKIKEKFYKDAIAEYAKRLSRYCNFEIVEVADEMTPDGAGDNERELIKKKEAVRIISKIRDTSYVCTLEINGDRYTSEKFAGYIEKLAVSGKSHITFVIGGSLGLHSLVTDRADWHLSFSDMTFPHQLMRLILSEQIYRAFRIINNEPYNK
jgi:23S rRNA (pseudouridine1915-N3)-methyltransferase